MLRSLSLQLRGEPETQLPLTREEDLIKTDDVLDLSELASASQQGDPAMLAHTTLRGSGLVWDRELTECACPTKPEERTLDSGHLEVSLQVLLSRDWVELSTWLAARSVLGVWGSSSSRAPCPPYNHGSTGLTGLGYMKAFLYNSRD